jgi:choline dehydrogenase-like flavoprotein
MFILREAIRSARRFVKAPVWQGYINLPPDVPETDDDLNKLITSKASNLHHPVGTAAMSAADASYGVLNPDLRVKGVAGLRVVDSSAFVSPLRVALLHICPINGFIQPYIPCAHTMVATYIFGERGADLIKQAWS